MRVAIVGAGILGMMAAWKLARQGHRVVLVDAGRIPNPDGASFDQQRLLHDFEFEPRRLGRVAARLARGVVAAVA